ncbi:MAG: 50S ribosomal protein L10 [Parcubacteria group bacterium]|nr:50S ribosomal protein L10 [Parcubacteria group bacterium]
MAITKEKKSNIIADLTKQFSEAKFLVFADFTGLSAVQMRLFKKALLDSGAKNKVAKKTLIIIALEKAGFKGKISEEALEGQVTVTLNDGDLLKVSKVNRDFAKEYPTFKILGGIFKGEFVLAEDIKKLGAIPSQSALYAQLAGLLNNIIGRFVFTLKQLEIKKS